MAERQRSVRRPRQSYFEMGLNVGDRVVFEQISDEVVHIAGKYHLSWGGKTLSLTKLRERLGDKLKKGIYSGRITVNGKDFDAIYDETYGPKHQTP